LGVLEAIKVIKSDYRKVFSKLDSQQFDFIFADPPFDLGYIDELLKLLDKNYSILKKNGYIIIEKSKNERYNVDLKHLILNEIRDYSDTELLILQRKQEE